ncbi:centrosomal protein 20 isoform X2 [Takifugu rubripes]|uniref:Centrosomal protein 20 n=2 Tax=Takifugu TaxID=31032 RepID=H2TWH9_TAKRU|nr:lisH domain-containing protein FOPNL isoform X2 [Takifugu rubripes]XP_056892796.1 lisH domain-containing protein FOPNL [Takifugu flavidus]TWW58589.1 LisH domain-containing protein FOPNL FGFR1OP N-terminal-like protein [Takifugu flavidus]
MPVAMATISELKCAIKETLESRGVWAQLKAGIRAEVFGVLDNTGEPRPPLSHENLLINELIREYLEFNKYRYTASVLTAESGQPDVPLDRQFLANELKVTESASSKSVPLLYGLVSYFVNNTDNLGKVFLRGSSLPPTTNKAPRSDVKKL